METITPEKFALLAELFCRLYYPAAVTLCSFTGYARQQFEGIDIEYNGTIYTNPLISFGDDGGYVDEYNTLHKDLFDTAYLGIMNDDLDKQQFVNYHRGKVMTLIAACVRKDEFEKYHGNYRHLGRWAIHLRNLPDDTIRNILDNGVFLPESEISRRIREGSNQQYRELLGRTK